MKQNFITLAAATAIGLVMSASAYAGDANTLYIDQKGDSNVADVHQTGSASHPSSGGNDIGLDGAPILQDGDRNYFNYTNDNHGSGFDNDIVKLKQDGNDNWFRANDLKNASGNRVNDVLQDGDRNQARIWRSNEHGSIVDTLTMRGDRNVISITQGLNAVTSGNLVSNVSIIGDDNGYPHASGFGSGGILLKQFGTGNTITEASIKGSNNRSWTVPTGVRITQDGSNNGNLFSIARMKGSDGNFIGIDQIGDENQFNMQQGVGVNSTGNQITLLQTGNENRATGTQRGDFNQMDVVQAGNWNGVQVDQQGNTNTASVQITGDSNGLDLALPRLTSGLISQDGNENSVLLTAIGNSNAFGFKQKGNENSIDAIQTGDNNQVGGSQVGNLNQAVISQGGSSNIASFVQNGSFNVVGISQ